MFLENFALHYIAEKAQMKICKHIRIHECTLNFFMKGKMSHVTSKDSFIQVGYNLL